MKITELDPQWQSIISNDALEFFEQQYPNLLVCFDTGAVYSAIASYFRVEGLSEVMKDDFTPGTLCKETEQAFLTLLRRGALDHLAKIKPLPALAQEELDEMGGVAPAVIDSATQARQRDAEAIQECSRDNRVMDSRSFRLKYSTPAGRAIFEKAIAAKVV